MMAVYTGGWARFLSVVLFVSMTVLGISCAAVAADGDDDVSTDAGTTCYQCHSKPGVTPWIASTWAVSRHAATGVLCSNCHGNHDGGFDSDKFTALPGPNACVECHPIQVKQTLASSHARLVKCASCHPRHTFSLNVARNPGICATCHAGSEHVDGYAHSKMGVIYTTEGAPYSATCQTCHMPGGIHDVDMTIKDNGMMLQVCNRCHSASFAGKKLEKGGFKLHW